MQQVTPRFGKSQD